jgi:hypothetical protein
MEVETNNITLFAAWRWEAERAMQVDWTHAAELAITLSGQTRRGRIS